MDSLEFLKALRKDLIEQYMAIIMGSESSNCVQRCIPYLEGIYDFLEQTASIEGVGNIEVIKNIIALIGDMATYFKGNPGVKAKSTLPYVEQLIMTLQQQPQADIRE